MRGLHPCRERAITVSRYNPAYAGTTQRNAYEKSRCEIQPRVCGDYAAAHHVPRLRVDTTPRMRGLRTESIPLSSSTRYNPAYAGTTSPMPSASAPATIQPRVCGDYSPAPRSLTLHRDTTPRMRGLRTHQGGVYMSDRYNPAYAGTTIERMVTPWRQSIQPRVCGDY